MADFTEQELAEHICHIAKKIAELKTQREAYEGMLYLMQTRGQTFAKADDIIIGS
jgi:hypothetical protein